VALAEERRRMTESRHFVQRSKESIQKVSKLLDEATLLA